MLRPQASTPAAWLENLVLMEAGVRPPLLLDPLDVALPLLQVLNGGNGTLVALDVHEHDLASKVGWGG